jgi:4-amino-4-deoxy-L-arabinose transferase-like glycosyltransferase
MEASRLDDVNGRSGLWLWAILLLGAALRLFPIWFGLPYLYARPDEETAIDHALRILGGDFNPHFFHWPSLTFYALAALFAGAGWIAQGLSIDSAVTAAGHLLIGRGFVAIMGTLTIAVLFRLGCRVGDRATGLAAALFLAVAILHVRDSHFAMTDVLMTFLSTSAIALLLHAFDGYAEPGRDGTTAAGRFAMAGLFGGLATSTKYSAAAILASMAGAQLMLVSRRSPARGIAWSFMPSAVFVGALAAGFLLGTPYAALDARTFVADVQYTITHLRSGHGIDLGPGWSYHFTHSLPYGVGIPTFAAGLVGVVPFMRHSTRHAGIVLTFAVALYASLGSGRTVFFRYTMPLVPVVCLLAAVGVRHAAPWVASRVGLSLRSAFAIVVVLIALPSVVNSVWFDVLLARKDTRVLAAEWLAERLDPEASLHDAASPFSRLDLHHLRFHEWSFDARSKSFGDSQGRMPDWLVLHESPLLIYGRAPLELRQLAQEQYALAATFPATRGRARSAMYDQQDAFFMPISGFHTVNRPGPTISIYRRAITSSPRTARPSPRDAARDSNTPSGARSAVRPDTIPAGLGLPER